MCDLRSGTAALVSQTLAKTFVRKTLSNSDEEMLATETLLFCSEEYLSARQQGASSDLTASTIYSPGIANQNVKTTQLSSSLFDDQTTKFFIVQIAGNARERQVFVR